VKRYQENEAKLNFTKEKFAFVKIADSETVGGRIGSSPEQKVDCFQ
jgi:hypothetical protein